MKIFLISLFFLPLITSAATPTTPLPPPSNNNITAAASPKARNHHQINNIIDALLGAGDFNSWINILSASEPIPLPLSATLFIPANDSPSQIHNTIASDPLIFPYHIVPQRLSFADLCQFNISSRLPTLLSSNSILITNNSIANFTLDDSLVSHPDMFTSESIAVHGVSSLLDYAVYGNPSANDSASQPEIWSRPPPGMFVPKGQLISGGDHNESGAGSLCSDVLLIVFMWLVCSFLMVKIERTQSWLVGPIWFTFLMFLAAFCRKYKY